MQGVNRTKRGFTLIEILVVIGLIAVLAGVVLVAINPGRQFAQGRDSQRVSNLNAILNAISQRMADNKGVFEGTFSISGVTYTCGKLPSTIGTTSITTAIAASQNIETGALGCLVPTYMPNFPMDPASGSGAVTGYAVYATSSRVWVVATSTEPNIPRETDLYVAR